MHGSVSNHVIIILGYDAAPQKLGTESGIFLEVSPVRFKLRMYYLHQRLQDGTLRILLVSF